MKTDKDLLSEEEEEQKKKERMQEAWKYYVKEQEFLEHQSRSSFGKMIPATVKTEPKYSIGKALRKPWYQFTSTPGPIYSQKAAANMRFPAPPTWKIGDSKRPPLSSSEHYEYYDYPYDEASDLSKIPKKWGHIKGGAPTLEARVKYDFAEKVPGPGRYDPDDKAVRSKAPAYYWGIKPEWNSIMIPTGTGKNVAPWTYNQSNTTKLSQHPFPPKISFNKDKRKGLNQKVWTKNETYFLYSSIGSQIMTHKPTAPIESFSKATRDKSKKCGMFKSMMERVPTTIRIQMPKF